MERQSAEKRFPSERNEPLFKIHVMGHIGVNAMVSAIRELKLCREFQQFNITRKGRPH